MTPKERILTPAEQKRKEIFDEKAQELTQQGYKQKDLTVSVAAANVLALVVMLPVIVAFFVLYFAVNRQGDRMLSFSLTACLLFLVAFLATIVVHEGIHGIIWAIFAKEHFRDISFGVIWSALTPYCTCKASLTKGQYLIGGLMPTILLGLLPAIAAIASNHFGLFLFAMMLVLAGGGDALIALKLLRHRESGKHCVYIDHPYECGLVVFEQTNREDAQ